jgi:flagellar biosynthesis protein FliP
MSSVLRAPTASAQTPQPAAPAAPVTDAATPADPAAPTDPVVARPSPELPRVPAASGTVERPATGPQAPEIPVQGGVVDFIEPTDGPEATVNIDLGGATDRPSNSILVIVLISLLSVAPSLIVLMSSFTRIAVVLSLTRNALGLQAIPPNQVITGLALFLSLFVMKPTLESLNNDALQPYLRGEITQEIALERAQTPIRTFMLKQTDQAELSMLLKASGEPRPAKPDDVSLLALIPAFILSELKKAFIIGFIIFIPFLVVDIVVSSTLMSVGMMMLPPVLVSLPFKLLLFVMVDGWGLIIKSLLESFR